MAFILIFTTHGWTNAEDLWLTDSIRAADGTWGRISGLRERGANQRMYNLTVDEAHTFFVGHGQWLVHNSGCGKEYVRVDANQQVANSENFIFKMTQHEQGFVRAVRSERPNLQIYRTHNTAQMGDFVIVDLSNPLEPVGWVAELKTAPGAPQAGTQLARASQVAKDFGLVKYEAVTGNIDELLSILSKGRGSW